MKQNNTENKTTHVLNTEAIRKAVNGICRFTTHNLLTQLYRLVKMEYKGETSVILPGEKEKFILRTKVRDDENTPDMDIHHVIMETGNRSTVLTQDNTDIRRLLKILDVLLETAERKRPE
mgnify:CR=1 FL=1